MKKKNCKQNRRMIYKKTMCLTLSTIMVLSLEGCGHEEAKQETLPDDVQEQVLNDVLNAQVKASHSSEAGKEETVYVLADANGGVNQVIVSNWLKNADGGQSLADSSELTDIENVKGYETFEKDADGNIIWQADGSDIYYKGTTDKELPVEVKISYQLDGQNISADDLAGKSGRVTIRMDYENKETRKVRIGEKEQEIKVPFAMLSGMLLPQDTFSNIEVTNARLLSEGNNSIVVGLAFPGLKDSIDAEGLKDRLKDAEDKEAFEDLEIPDYIEVSADTESFELGMTMTVAMSDILSDIELTDSLDLSELNDSMDKLRDATDQLKDGTAELKDGSGQLKDGTGELAAGANELWDGTTELKDGSVQLKDGAVQLKDGTQELYEKSGLLNNGALALYDGTVALQAGTGTLAEGAGALQVGGQKLADGTGSLAAGVVQLNNGAIQVKNGVNQMVGQINKQMGMLKAAVGIPVNPGSPDEVSNSLQNPQTLLQLSYALNQVLNSPSGASAQAETSGDDILQGLTQQRAQVQAALDNANASLAAAQDHTASAQTEMAAACQGSIQEYMTVSGTHTEDSYVEMEVNVNVPTVVSVESVAEDSGESTGEESAAETDGSETNAGSVTEEISWQQQTVMGTGVVPKEVVDFESVQIQTVNADDVQQKAAAYQSAVEEAARYQAEINAYVMQLAMIDEEIALVEANTAQMAGQQAAQAQALSAAGMYAAALDGALTQIYTSINVDNSKDIAALMSGVEQLANGTQSALSGAQELNQGANELKNGLVSLNSGVGELADGASALKDGAEELKGGTGQLVEGTGTLNDGAGDLKDGMETLDDGIGTLKDGVGTLKDGVFTLDEGMNSLDEGALELLNGMFEFDEEGISKLTELFGDDVQDVVDRLKAVADAGKEYNTFTGLSEDMDGSVKFVIRTESVELK